MHKLPEGYRFGGYKFDDVKGVRRPYYFRVMCNGCQKPCKGIDNSCINCKDELYKPSRRWEVEVIDDPEPIPDRVNYTEEKGYKELGIKDDNVNAWRRNK